MNSYELTNKRLIRKLSIILLVRQEYKSFDEIENLKNCNIVIISRFFESIKIMFGEIKIL